MNWSRLQKGFIRRVNRLRPVHKITIPLLESDMPGCWQPVHPTWQAAWPGRLPSGAVPECFGSRLSQALPARGVLRLHDASVLGDPGWVFTANNRVVIDTTAFVDAERWIPPVHLPLLRGGARRLRGRTLSLLSNWSSCNFYHMLVETIPRIEMLFAAGWRWHDFDQILLPAFSPPTIERLLTSLELPREKVIPVNWNLLNYFRTDELVCTSFPGGRRTVLPTQIDYLRRLQASLPAAGKGRGRKLFVSRRARIRHLRNEPELLPLLEARGFTVVDPGDLANAEGVFREADYVVGTHGASLANLVFCRPGTKVLELVPSDQAYPYFYTLAVHGGLDYDCLIGPSDHEHQRHPSDSWNSPSDFTVDIAAFTRSLDRLLS